MKTSRRDFLKGSLAGIFSAFLTWAGAVKAEEKLEQGNDIAVLSPRMTNGETGSELPIVTEASLQAGTTSHPVWATNNVQTEGFSGVWCEEAEREFYPALYNNELQNNTNGLGDLYSQNGELTFERVAEARRKLERCTHSLGTVDRSRYDSFEVLCVEKDEYGTYWLAKVEKDGKRFTTGNYYCLENEAAQIPADGCDIPIYIGHGRCVDPEQPITYSGTVTNQDPETGAITFEGEIVPLYPSGFDTTISWEDAKQQLIAGIKKWDIALDEHVSIVQSPCLVQLDSDELEAMSAAGDNSCVFVDPNKGDDQAGGGTGEKPYATIARAIQGEDR